MFHVYLAYKVVREINDKFVPGQFAACDFVHDEVGYILRQLHAGSEPLCSLLHSPVMYLHTNISINC